MSRIFIDHWWYDGPQVSVLVNEGTEEDPEYVGAFSGGLGIDEDALEAALNLRDDDPSGGTDYWLKGTYEWNGKTLTYVGELPEAVQSEEA